MDCASYYQNPIDQNSYMMDPDWTSLLEYLEKPVTEAPSSYCQGQYDYEKLKEFPWSFPGTMSAIEMPPATSNFEGQMFESSRQIFSKNEGNAPEGIHYNLCNSTPRSACKRRPSECWSVSSATSSNSSKRACSEENDLTQPLLLQTSPSPEWFMAEPSEKRKSQDSSPSARFNSYQPLIVSKDALSDAAQAEIQFKKQQKVERTIASLAQMRSRALESMLDSYVQNKQRSAKALHCNTSIKVCS